MRSGDWLHPAVRVNGPDRKSSGGAPRSTSTGVNKLGSSVKWEGVKWGRIERGGPFVGCPSLDPVPLPHPAVQGTNLRARDDNSDRAVGMSSTLARFSSIYLDAVIFSPDRK
jgi:hypothetical protein